MTHEADTQQPQPQSQKPSEPPWRKASDSLEGKNVTVLAGTGPVGQTAARIYAAEKANVTITCRALAKGQAVADKINKEVGAERVKVVEVTKPEQTAAAIKDAEIILSAGAGGIQLLSAADLNKSSKCKIVADINAIKPLGVEGLGSNDDGKELKPGVYGIGALAIGKLKIKTETEMIKRATDEPQGLFDYAIAYDIAKDANPKETSKSSCTNKAAKLAYALLGNIFIFFVILLFILLFECTGDSFAGFL